MLGWGWLTTFVGIQNYRFFEIIAMEQLDYPFGQGMHKEKMGN